MNAAALAVLAAGVGGAIIGLRWGRWERHDLTVHAVRQHQEILRLLDAQEHAHCNSTIRLLSDVVRAQQDQIDAQQGYIDHVAPVVNADEDLDDELQRLIEGDA